MTVAVAISPVWNGTQFFDNLGKPLSGGLIYTYEGGSSSVEQTTYSDSDGSVPNSNPLVLDSSGRLQADMWLISGDAYNLVLTQPDGQTVLQGVDNVIGVAASTSGGGGPAGLIWNPSIFGAAYINGTQFRLAGNDVTNFAVGNRVQITQTGGLSFGTVSAVSFSSPNTLVTLVDQTVAINSGISSAAWSALTAVGATVDAGAVTYNVSGLTYPTAATVGAALRGLISYDAAQDTRITSLQQVWPTTGSGADTPFTITPSPAISAYTAGQIFTVQFQAASAGNPTMAVNSLAALPLKQYATDGSLTIARTLPDVLSDIAYDGTNFIMLDSLPPAAAGAPSHGCSAFGSNGSYTVPAGVYSIEVNCVGGGGGGGGAGSYTTGGSGTPTTVYTAGGQGGFGGCGISVLSVTPGTVYAMTIGAAGPGGLMGANGTAGGNTTFGSSLVVATGGASGHAGSTSPGSNGANGYGSTSTYGTDGIAYALGSSPRGKAGAGALPNPSAAGAAGTAGLIIIKY